MVKCGCCSRLFWVASLVCTCFGVNGFFLPKSITLLCRLTLQQEKQRGKAKVIGKQIRLDSQRSLTQGCFDISHPAFRIFSHSWGLDGLYLYFSLLSVAYVSEFVTSAEDFVACLQVCESFIDPYKATFKRHRSWDIYIYLDRRKFRRLTSDNMDSWKAEQRSKVSRKKLQLCESQKKEDTMARNVRKVPKALCFFNDSRFRRVEK